MKDNEKMSLVKETSKVYSSLNVGQPVRNVESKCK
jgi:hypothetical protein